jgi:hypothetical protein
MLLLHVAEAQESVNFFNEIPKWINNHNANVVMIEPIVNAAAMLLSHGLNPNESCGQDPSF